MTELVKLYQRCNKNHHNVDFGLILIYFLILNEFFVNLYDFINNHKYVN